MHLSDVDLGLHPGSLVGHQDIACDVRGGRQRDEAQEVDEMEATEMQQEEVGSLTRRRRRGFNRPAIHQQALLQHGNHSCHSAHRAHRAE